MAEYTDLYCNSPETAEAVKAYMEEELRRGSDDDDVPSMEMIVVKSTLWITYLDAGRFREAIDRFREAIDAQLLGYRDGYDAGRKEVAHDG